MARSLTGREKTHTIVRVNLRYPPPFIRALVTDALTFPFLTSVVDIPAVHLLLRPRRLVAERIELLYPS